MSYDALYVLILGIFPITFVPLNKYIRNENFFDKPRHLIVNHKISIIWSQVEENKRETSSHTIFLNSFVYLIHNFVEFFYCEIFSQSLNGKSVFFVLQMWTNEITYLFNQFDNF